MVGLTYPQTEYTQIHLYKQYFESGLETNFNYCKEFILFILFFYAKMVVKQTPSNQAIASMILPWVKKQRYDLVQLIVRMDYLFMMSETISSKK